MDKNRTYINKQGKEIKLLSMGTDGIVFYQFIDKPSQIEYMNVNQFLDEYSKVNKYISSKNKKEK